MPRRNALFLIVILVASAANLLAQAKPDAPAFDVKEHYTKYEYRIAMRDGKKLFTKFPRHAGNLSLPAPRAVRLLGRSRSLQTLFNHIRHV